MNGLEQPVQRDGIDYPSQAAFAQAMGVSAATVSNALTRGRLDTVGTGSKYHGKPREIDGVRYATTLQAMSELGITWRALQKRVKAQVAVSPKSGSRYSEGARA